MQVSVVTYRRGRFNPDFWAKFIQWVGIVTWFFVLAATFTALFSNSIADIAFLQSIIRHLPQQWAGELLAATRWMMLYLGALFLLGFLITIRQPAHKERKYAPSFRLLSQLALMGIVTHLVILVF